MISREILIGNFETEITTIKCPNCKSGILLVDKNLHKRFPTGYSVKEYSEEFYGWQNEFQSIFCDFFHCHNKNCKETAILTGIINATTVFEYNAELGEDVPNYKYDISITHIEPTIDLFEIPIDLPLNLVYELKKVFYIFWTDKDACANKIRIFIELLLDEMQIPPAKKLHHRIEKYMLQNDDANIAYLGKYIMAIKWIGNDGSHSEKKLTYNIIDGLEILEYALRKYYDKSEKLVTEKVNEINSISQG